MKAICASQQRFCYGTTTNQDAIALDKRMESDRTTRTKQDAIANRIFVIGSERLGVKYLQPSMQ
ncbi:MAG: hypothetical protein ICV78_27020 [Tolypothrix sp. Co-bin9]|nr:hypothetical protein [Tolypothrix sp. Co-bin9]